MRYVLSALLLLTPSFRQEARSDQPDLTIVSRIKPSDMTAESVTELASTTNDQ
jgi:hypothetical protein